MEFEIDQKTPPETFEHFHNITKHNVMDDIVHLNVLYSVFFFFTIDYRFGRSVASIYAHTPVRTCTG